MYREDSEWTLKKKLILGIAIFVVLTFLITSFFGRRGVIEIFKYKDEIAQLEKEVAVLKKEKKKLEVEVKELEKNSMAAEPIARRDLWYKKKGEVVIVFKNKDRNSEK